MDGKPFHYVAGSFHYFRQHPDYWEENLKKMANCGLNAVQTYVAWNVHEPEQGQFNWEGFGDLERFISLCDKLGLYVILRPGPFICAEWEGGGFPYWLQNCGVSTTRRSDEAYLRYVDEWFKVLLGKMKSHMYVNGGNIITVQVENEYGCNGGGICDHDYLKHMCSLIRSVLGDETVLFTTDTAYRSNLECGSEPDLALVTVDFPTEFDPREAFKLAREFNKGKGPLVDSEYYTGWIDHWGEKHHTVDVETLTEKLDLILSMNASVCFYMFYGGTNFGYWAGANGAQWSGYEPDPTSYDYDAPLSEAGDMTYKYERIKEIVSKYYPENIKHYDVHNSSKKSYGKLQLSEGVSLFDFLDKVSNREIRTHSAKSFEQVNHAYGFMLYSVDTNGGWLTFDQVNDRVIVFVNKKYVDIMQRNWEFGIEVPAGRLDILIEDLGRTNLGCFLDSKGIINAKLNKKVIEDWKITPIELEKACNVPFTSKLPVHTPALYRGILHVDEVGDTFVKVEGFRHGVIIVNGFNIGRHWEAGPQVTYYVPGPILRVGTNEIIIFETDDLSKVPTISFEEKPQLDK